ncbi:MAG: hypothetical protein WD607_04020 [Candidatus Paceibacterota bacterium]
MKSKTKFTESEIIAVNHGYQQYLEGKTISHNKANKLFKKWLELKLKP